MTQSHPPRNSPDANGSECPPVPDSSERPPAPINRRRFLGHSAVAGLAVGHSAIGNVTAMAATTALGLAAQSATAAATEFPVRRVRLGLIGAGNRGLNLARTLLELDGVELVAVADTEERHRERARAVIRKGSGVEPAGFNEANALLESRAERLDAVILALPCDLHAPVALEALRAGQSIYLEKPLAPTLEECDALLAEARKRPDLAVHVGYQRRSHPRYIEARALLERGELGRLLTARGSWISSNGPLDGHHGWLSRRARSGDWMVEQAVHVWDVVHWFKGSPPARAFGMGRRDLFAATQPERDVTDEYTVTLEWADGFRLEFRQSWIDPADDAFTGVTLQLVGERGGLDLASGRLTFRDRSQPRRVLHPGTLPDTRLALEAFVAALRTDQPGLARPPLTLEEAGIATRIGLLVRRAVDERRIVTWDEVAHVNASQVVATA